MLLLLVLLGYNVHLPRRVRALEEENATPLRSEKKEAQAEPLSVVRKEAATALPTASAPTEEPPAAPAPARVKAAQALTLDLNGQQFSRVFRAAEGRTPLQYRRLHAGR